MNGKSLKELNAYVDRIEGADIVQSPFVGRKLQFFVPVVNKKKERVPGMARPVIVELPTVGPSADMLEKEEAAVALVGSVETCMNTQDIRFSWKSVPTVASVEPIIRSTSRSNKSVPDVRRSLDQIWKQELFDTSSKQGIFHTEQSAKTARFHEYKSIQIHNKLLAKYMSIKNPRKRAMRIEGIPLEVAESMDELVKEDLPEKVTSDGATRLRIIESGFHPDLVFFSPSITPSEQQEGLHRVCGANLSIESDTWLLENLWKAVRSSEYPPVPIVLGESYSADLAGGYLSIPFDFTLQPDLVDFLEENLDTVRAERRKLLEEFVAV